MRLEVVPVSSLRLHEEILPEVVRKLTYEFSNWTNLQNPIIIDENGIVLDGNHRAFVFRKLNFRYIPVCRIDYFHEKTGLRYWFRLLGNLPDLGPLRDAVEEMGGVLQPLKDSESMKECLARDCLAAGVQKRDFFAIIRFDEDSAGDPVCAYGALQKIQDRLLEEGTTLEFIPCKAVYRSGFCDRLRDDEIVIWTPHITKEMVVRAAMENRQFAPKTTRHCIPARPLNVNVPTSWFKENVSLDEINRRFSDFLEGKDIRRFGPGQILDGRYYEEELFVFFDR